ncbi:translocation/assembly module TamB domain-containing protein [Gemmatimonas sp.]|uniref:translocation/assembly module TamB domain-containing protein n=1 Tax=Gemmatimonas sp. TaxID=1962908 RepID=UPI0037BFEA84
MSTAMSTAMSPRQRRFWWAAAIVLGLGGGMRLGYHLATGTEAGRRWLLATLVARANAVFGGRGALRIGVLREISPGRVVADEVTLVDTAGVPVVTAQRLVGTLDTRGLFSRRIHIRRLALDGVVMTLRQEAPGRSWNIAHIITGDTTKATPLTDVRFGDDVRIDSLSINGGVVTTRAPWAPHPVFTGRARDSVIVVRDSLHDLERLADGQIFENRRITLDRVTAHDVVLVDGKKRPASLQLDSLRGVLSDPPVPVRQASGRITWTSDSLQLDLRDVQLPASHGTATGMVAWNAPGPVRFDVLVKAEAGLSDLAWIWDVMPREGRGTATVRLRTLTDANDAEYDLQHLDVQSGASRVRGGIAVTVRPADLLLRKVDLSFTPLTSDLLRRLSYDAVPAAVRGLFSGRLLAADGGALTAFKVDRLDAHFVDAAVQGGDAVSSLRLAGTLAFGARPRVSGLTAEALRLDLRSVRLLLADAPAIDGIVTGAGLVRHADLSEADLGMLRLTWTDGVGNVSRVRGNARVRFGGAVPDMRASLVLDPLSMRALARVDTTLVLRSDIAGTVQLDGSLDDLRWGGQLVALNSPATGRALTLDSLGQLSAPSVALHGTASIQRAAWRGTAAGTLANFDARIWLGQDGMPSTALSGRVRLSGRGPLDTTAVAAGDTTGVRAVEGSGEVLLMQPASAERPAFDLVASATLGRERLVVDSALAHMGGVTLEARGALARDTTQVDTLQIAMHADTLDTVRGELDRLAAMLQPVDTALAASVRAVAADTLSGDASLSGYLYGSLRKADATAALGARTLQVGAIRAGRIFGSARATDVLRRPAFEGTANADNVTGIGAVRLQTVTFRVVDASPDSGRLVLDVSTDEDAHLIVRGGYAIRGPATAVHLDSLRLNYDDVTWRAAQPIVVVSDSGGLRLRPAELRSSVGGVLTVGADIPTRGAVQGTLRVERFPFGEVAALLAGAPLVAGTVTGRAELSGTRAAPLMTWDITADSIGLDGVRLPPVTSTGAYADKRLTARAQVRDTLGGSVRAEGSVPLDLTLRSVVKRRLSDAVEGEVVADSLSLGALPLAIDGISRLRGILSGRLAVGGTVERPAASGVVMLEQAGARVDDLGIEPTDGRIVLRAAADSLTLETFRLRSGGGNDTVGAQGVLRFAAGELPARVALQVVARNFIVSRQRDGTDLDVGGDVRLEGSLSRPVVSGSLFVPRANLVVDPLGARTALDLSSDAARALLGADEVPVAESAAQSLSRLGSYLRVENTRVELGNDVWVQTPESRVKLSGGLTVTMSGDRLGLDGEILANRGQYRLELGVVNRSFSVDSGRVRFFGNNAIAPTLDISATNVVRVAGGSEIPVRVNIGGNYDRPVLTLSSPDPLYASAPESEIISLLIFGAPTFALDGQSQSTVRAVTGVLLPSVGGAVEGALQRLLPVFNTVQVTTAGSNAEAAFSPTALLDNLNFSISAGKQFGERTFLRLNTGVCRGTSQATSRGATLWGGVAAEYRIARNWWGQVGVDPGSAPCTRPAGDVFPRLQFGFDLFREWIF